MDSRAFADASRDDQLAFVKFASGCYEGEGERERESEGGNQESGSKDGTGREVALFFIDRDITWQLW